MPHGTHVPNGPGTKNLRSPDPETRSLQCLMYGDGDEAKTWWTKDDYIRRQCLDYSKNRDDSRIEWLVWLAGSFHGKGKRRNGQWELEVKIEDQTAARSHP